MHYTLRDGVLFACAAGILILSYTLQPTSVISRDSHTSLSGGEVVSSFDTHGGAFRGDGNPVPSYPLRMMPFSNASSSSPIFGSLFRRMKR